MTAPSPVIADVPARNSVAETATAEPKRIRPVAGTLRLISHGMIPGALGVAAITSLAFRFRLSFTSAAFLHMIVVVLVARQAGFWWASLVSLIAVAGQLYFLVPPALSFDVADPRNWLALATFEYCALTVSGLSDRAAKQTLAASQRQKETDGLYQVSRLVLLMDREREPGPQLTGLIQRVFHCETVGLFDAELARFAWSGTTVASFEGDTKDTYNRAVDRFQADDRTWFRVLRIGVHPIGSLTLHKGGITETVANALASLVAVALERSHAFEEDSRAAAARQRELLRTAVLDAMAHDVKTPLTVIRVASSGLRNAGGLGPRQAGLLTLIDNEAGHLNEIMNRLLGMARLDEMEVRLKPQSLRLDLLVRGAVNAFKSRWPGRAIRTSGFTPDMVIAGDEHLLETGLAQLIDNAFRYSIPHSMVSIGADRGADEVLLSVHNRGPVIPPEDLERIFERFYRSAGSAYRITGTGLGLSIARNIAAAHCGRVWAESDVVRGTTLFLALPLISRED